jgi:hypothetical protein
MFIAKTSRAWTGVSGSFLILFSRYPEKEIRGLVRHVRLVPSGHFMVGSALAVVRSRGKPNTEFDISLSGEFGSDGLTKNPDQYRKGEIFLWDYLFPLPQEVSGPFWKDTTGQSREFVHRWAGGHVKELRSLKLR